MQEPTAAETIVELGGDGLVAAWLGVGRSAVRNWRGVGVFPPRHLAKLGELADLKGKRLDQRLFRELPRKERR